MLIGRDNIEKTYTFLIDAGCTPEGAFGIMGNLAEESGEDINPEILQITFQKKLNMSSSEYMRLVNLGVYTPQQFENDGAGWGICQFTYHTLKAGLLTYCKSKGKSIGDLECQLEYMISVIKKDCKQLWAVVTTTDSIREASNRMLFDFERPSDQGKIQQDKRCAHGEKYRARFVNKTSGNNSKLVDVVVLSPNKNSKTTSSRTKRISKITIHHMAGNLSVEECGRTFADPNREASSNYGIGTDGRVGLYVEEKDTAWTSGSYDNDNMAVTIEVANNSGAPYWTVSNMAYWKLVDLCTDICKRNGIKKLVWTGDASGNLTCHYMFQATACPGPYLKERMSDIAAEVNSRLGVPTDPVYPKVPFLIRCNKSVVIFDSKGKPTGGQTGVGVFTIVDISKNYGKLKSGAGYVDLTSNDIVINDKAVYYNDNIDTYIYHNAL